MFLQGKLIAATVTLILVETVSHINGLECMACHGVNTLSECLRNTVICGTGEKCYLEMVTTDTLKIQYNAGCRSSRICSVMATLASGIGKRKRRDLINCAQCCDDNSVRPCNTMLCGQRPDNTSDFCYNCEGVSSLSACTKKTLCPHNQVCWNSVKVVGTLIRYSYGCKERHICEALYKNGFAGKRSATSVTICDACCVGDACNKEDCFSLRTHFNATSFAPLSAHSSG